MINLFYLQQDIKTSSSIVNVGPVKIEKCFNPLSASRTLWLNTLKQFVGNLPTNCLNVFDDFVELVPKGLRLIKLSLNIRKTKHTLFHKTFSKDDISLTLSWRRSLSYRNQSIDLLSKLVDWSLYDRDFRHKKAKASWFKNLKSKYRENFFHNDFGNNAWWAHKLQGSYKDSWI